MFESPRSGETGVAESPSCAAVRVRRSFPPVAWLHEREAQGLAWPTVVIDASVSGDHRPNVLGPLTLFTVERGIAELVLEGRRLSLAEQTYAISPANQRFTLDYPEDVRVRAFNVYFADDLVADVTAGMASRSPLDLRPPVPGSGAPPVHSRLRPMGDWLRSAISRVRRATSARQSLAVDEAIADLLTAVLGTPDVLFRPTTTPAAERDELLRRIGTTVDYLVAHSTRRVTLTELAKVCGVSKFHFLRVFRDAVGSTPSRFLTQVRIERAMALLRTTERSVTDIALEVGFSEQSALTRAFQRRVGASPVAYRARERH